MLKWATLADLVKGHSLGTDSAAVSCGTHSPALARVMRRIACTMKILTDNDSAVYFGSFSYFPPRVNVILACTKHT